MKTMLKLSLFAIAAFALAACQPAANTSTNTNSNANTAPKAAAPTADSLMALDSKAWDAYISKDGAFFNQFLADNFVGFDNGKHMTKAEVVKEISENKCEIKSHTLTEPKLTMAGPDAAVVTYKATVDGTCEGKKVPSPVTVASVFVRSGNEWKGAYHNEVMAMEPKGGDASADTNKGAATGTNKSTSSSETNKAAADTEKKESAAPAKEDTNKMSSNSNAAAPASGSDALTDAIMAVEKKGWEAWMKQDAKGLEETTAKDVTFVDVTGKVTVGQAAVIKEWTNGACKVTSVDVSDGKATEITKDVAILTYKGTAVGTCGDMKLEPLWGTTVAIKEGGLWKAVYIFETPIMKS
jgi:ketosteroid isomerase-like protein